MCGIGQYSPSVRAEIGKHACHHGLAMNAPSLFHTPPCLLHVLNFCRRPRAHTMKILPCEIFSHEPFMTWKYPDIRYAVCSCFRCWGVSITSCFFPVREWGFVCGCLHPLCRPTMPESLEGAYNSQRHNVVSFFVVWFMRWSYSSCLQHV